MIDSLTVADGLEAALGRGAGGGTDLGARSRGGAALAGTAAVRSGAGVAGWRDAAGGIGARAAGAGAGAVADWPGRRRARWVPTISPILLPGQSLVSRAGAIWRWDGYTIRAGTPTQAAVRLQQRNRLIGAADAAVRGGTGGRLAARTARTAAETAAQAAVAAEQAARNGRRDAEQQLERARASLRQSAQPGGDRDCSACRGGRPVVADQRSSGMRPLTALARARAAHAALPDIAALRAAVDQARAALSACGARERGTRRPRVAGARACRTGQSPPRDHRRTRRLGGAARATPPTG